MTPLSTLVLNCTLTPSPGSSSTELLARQQLAALEEHGAGGEMVRVVDHDVRFGVSTDEGDGDEWPQIRQKVLAADILVLATPIWMGQPSSVAKMVLERLDAELSETDEQGRMTTYDKVGLVAVVGNEDGAHHVSAEVYQALNDTGLLPRAQRRHLLGRPGHAGDRLPGPRGDPEETANATADGGPQRRPPGAAAQVRALPGGLTMRLPTPRGPLSEAVFSALTSPDAFAVDPCSPTRPTAATCCPPTTSSSRCGCRTSCTTAGSTTSPTSASGTPTCSACDATWRRSSRPSCATWCRPPRVDDRDFPTQLRDVIETRGGPPLAAHLHRHADRPECCSSCASAASTTSRSPTPMRSSCRGSDGRAKVALAELLYDEFGAGRPDALHSKLFADALAGAGLDPRYGAYVDETPATTLAVNNLMSLFGLHRRLRGAALGHLAAFETTSSVPCRRIAAGIERVGLPDVVAAYFHEHVEADAVHEQVALRDICGSLVDGRAGARR